MVSKAINQNVSIVLGNDGFVYLIFVYNFEPVALKPLTKTRSTVSIYGVADGSVQLSVPEKEPDPKTQVI